MTTAQDTDEFERLRPHLLSVAYRLTGVYADAEDIVQDAWLRWHGADVGAIAEPRAWLTTVVSRLGLDRLRSAAQQQEQDARLVGRHLFQDARIRRVAALGVPHVT